MAQEDTENTRSAMHVHTAMVAWLESEGHELDDMSPAEVIALAFAKRVAWRKTDIYRKTVEGHKASAESRQAEKVAAREAAKAEKAKARDEARAQKAAEREAAKAAKAEAAPKAEKATKASKAAPAPAKATKKATKGKATEEDPFS